MASTDALYIAYRSYGGTKRHISAATEESGWQKDGRREVKALCGSWILVSPTTKVYDPIEHSATVCRSCEQKAARRLQAVRV